MKIPFASATAGALILVGSALSTPVLAQVPAAEAVVLEETAVEPGAVTSYAETWSVSTEEATEQLVIQERMDLIDYAKQDPSFADIRTEPGVPFSITYSSAAEQVPEVTRSALAELAGVSGLAR